MMGYCGECGNYHEITTHGCDYAAKSHTVSFSQDPCEESKCKCACCYGDHTTAECTLEDKIHTSTPCQMCGMMHDAYDSCIMPYPDNRSPTVDKYVDNYGWTCPRCGRGNAPSNSTCACIPLLAT